MNQINKIKIKTEYITLGQFLKYVNIIENGAMAKIYLSNSVVLVNAEVECRRGRKLYPGYIIEVEQQKYIIE